MTFHLHPAIKKCGTFLPALLAALLLVCPLATVDAGAEYLLQSARQFSNPYTGMNDLQVGDVTGDGIPDAVVAGSYQDEWAPLVVTMPGLGDGTFGDAVITDSPLPRGITWWLVMAPLNGDQHPDLFLTYDDYDIGRGVLTLLGNGDGSFTMQTNLALDFSFVQLAAGDFTGNGQTDLAIAETSYYTPAVRIYQGAGDGTIAYHSTVSLDDEPTGVVTGDFDGDGDQDLACGTYFDDLIQLLLNDGSGTFTIHNYDPPYDPESLVAGDLNNDGYDDLVASGGFFSDYVWVYFGNAGGFGAWTVYTFAGDAAFMNLGDLDNDGDLDLVASGEEEDVGIFGQDRVCVLLNDGSGGFGDTQYFFRYGSHLQLDDMDGDGALDAVMAGTTNEYVCILPGRGDGTFSAMTDITFDSYAWGVGHADVDGDGDIDLALADPGDAYAALILRNNGDGSFADAESYYAGSGPRDVVFGDLDGDRLPEMVVVNFTNDQGDGISVLLNAGDGTFYDRRGYDIGYYTTDAALGDLDGDGDLDIAACHSHNLGVLINPGNGIFPEATLYPASQFPKNLCLGDMDGDGDLDAVLNGEVGYDEGPVLMTNNGDGSFTEPRRLASFSTEGLCLADFDGDGDLDVAAANDHNGSVAILLNDGTGQFSAPTEFPCGDTTLELAAGDIDWDGHIDLVAANERSKDIVLLRGLGGGEFGPPESYPLGQSPRDISLADFDGDGSLDVLTDSSCEVSASIFFSAGSTPGLLATGPGRGEYNPTLVRIFPAAGSGEPAAQWSAYGVDRWGVNVALGELTGSGSPEVVTGAGPGAVFGPHVRGFTIDGTPLPEVSWFAYGTNKYGVNVACGDLDSDGYDEIVTGAGPGAVFGPHVRGWNWDGTGTPTPIPGISYFAYGTPKWGVNVSCGDIDGDGYDEIVTGAGPGAVYGPHVRGWNCDGGGATSIPGVSFLAYGTNKFGVNVACGDIDGDGIDEMVTGAGPGAVFGPHVRAWNWDGSGTVQAIPAVSFFAYQYPRWGVNVSCGDLDDDGIDEILTGPGPGPDYLARVRGFNYDGQALSALGGVDFIAYDGAGNRYGVKVAGVR